MLWDLLVLATVINGINYVIKKKIKAQPLQINVMVTPLFYFSHDDFSSGIFSIIGIKVFNASICPNP